MVDNRFSNSSVQSEEQHSISLFQHQNTQHPALRTRSLAQGRKGSGELCPGSQDSSRVGYLECTKYWQIHSWYLSSHLSVGIHGNKTWQNHMEVFYQGQLTHLQQSFKSMHMAAAIVGCSPWTQCRCLGYLRQRHGVRWPLPFTSVARHRLRNIENIRKPALPWCYGRVFVIACDCYPSWEHDVFYSDTPRTSRAAMPSAWQLIFIHPWHVGKNYRLRHTTTGARWFHPGCKNYQLVKLMSYQLLAPQDGHHVWNQKPHESIH